MIFQVEAPWEIVQRRSFIIDERLSHMPARDQNPTGNLNKTGEIDTDFS
jgi:hypothetical protein